MKRFRSNVWVAVLVVLAVGCSATGGETLSTLVLDPECRDGGEVVADGTRWFLDQGSDVPRSWRARSEVEGVLHIESETTGRFLAADGTALVVRNDFRRLSCSLWE